MRKNLVVLSIALISSAAFAEEQAPSHDVPRPLEEVFEQGVEALRLNQFTRARDLFRRCLNEDPHPATAFNLARALRATGETHASLNLYDGLLAGEYGELSTEQDAEVRRLRAETISELATVLVRASGAPRIEIRIDGELMATLEDGERLQRLVDAGSRRITLSAPGFRTIEETVAVEQGSSISLERELERDAVAPLEDVDIPSQRSTRNEAPPPILRRAWFWVVLGLSAVALGIGIWLAVDRPWNEEITGHPVFGVVQTLSSTREPTGR